MQEETTNEDLLNLDPIDNTEWAEVDYSYRKRETVKLPAKVVDTEDENLMAEYIAKWIDDAEDIEIIGF